MTLAGALPAVLAFAVLIATPDPVAAVTYGLDYSDPASDVVKLWSSNMTPIPTGGGELTMSPFPNEVNLLRLRSSEVDGGANVSLTVQVMGDIVNLANTSYEVHLYTRSDNASQYVVTYVNGITTLSSNATGFTPIDITGNSTISSAGPNPTLQNELTTKVAKSLLGTIEVWNIDGLATQTGDPFTYRDFGWELPGNPGSAPPSENPSGSLGAWLWVMVAVAAAAVVVAVLAVRRRKSRAPPG